MGNIAKRVRFKNLLILLLKGYKYCISPLLGNRCRFYPSCSSYTQEAIQYYGACNGVLMGFKRLLKCHPWHTGGYDPVPQPRDR